MIGEYPFDYSCRLYLLVSIRVIQLYYHSYVNLAKVCPTNSKCRLKGGQVPDWRFQFRGQCFQTHGGENVLFRWGQRTSDELSDRRNMKQIVCSAYASCSKIFAVVGLLDLRDTVMKTVLPCTDQIAKPFWAILLTFCGDKIDPGHSGFTSMP